MPSQAPVNPFTLLAQRPVVPIVLLGADDATAPNFDMPVTFLRVLEVYRSCGAKNLDHAIFEYDLAGERERIVNYKLIPTARQVWIIVPGVGKEPNGTAVFWGELSKESPKIGRGEESIQIKARVEPYHFGLLCQGMLVRGLGDTAITVPKTIVFNPVIDGNQWGNESQNTPNSINASGPNFPTTPNGTFNLWVDPECVMSDGAVALQNSGGGIWPLADAAQTMMQWLNQPYPDVNKGMTFIQNEPPETTQATLAKADQPYNLKIQRGKYLPFYLDAILRPAGFDWYVSLSSELTATIKTFSRVSGVKKQVSLQPPGSKLDLSQTNSEELDLEVSIADLSNEIIGDGSLEEVEVTVPLYRGWDPLDDGLQFYQLDKTVLPAQGGLYQANPDVWRLFVANEDGSYTGLRPEITTAQVPKLDLAFPSGQNTFRRRKFQDCLTFDPSAPPSDEGIKLGRRRKPYLEYQDLNAKSPTWLPAPTEWGWQPLHEQMAIRFTGHTPPAQLMAPGSNIQLRITATIQGDQRLRYRAPRRTGSANIRNIALHLDMSDRFHQRVKVTKAYNGTKSPYASILTGPLATAGDDARDDTDALQRFVTGIQNVEDVAAMTASITLFGIHLEYQIGDFITKVDGRNISLSCTARGAPIKRYLQITGIKLNFKDQKTVLEVEPEYRSTLDSRLKKLAIEMNFPLTD